MMAALVTVATLAIHVGAQPTGMAYGAGSLWTANYGGGTVSRVDPVGQRVLKTISVGVNPAAIAFGAGAVWVGDFGASAVYRIDPASNTVTATVRLHSNVGGIARAPDGSMWVSEYASGAVDRIDPGTNTVTQRTRVGGNAEAIAFAAGKAWVTNNGGYVTPIGRSGKAGRRIRVAHDVDAIASTPRGLWVATYDGGVLARIDPRRGKVVRRVPFSGAGGGIAYVRRKLFVSDYSGGRVLRLDPSTGRVLKRWRVGSEPRDLVLAVGALWVVEQGSSDVRRIPLPAG
jgi:YVTN family beta-propeller protein